MKTTVYNQAAEVVGEIDLNPAIFEVKANQHLVAEAVRTQASNARKGLAHTKTRGDVSGGGKKPWKQKGTGRARAGSTRGPIWRHGGVAFGPRSDRNWSIKINRKAKTKALFMTLSDKAAHNKIIVLDSVTLAAPKTKDVVAMLKSLTTKLGTLGKRQLFVMPHGETILTKSARNLQSVTPMVVTTLNLTEVLKADTVVMLKSALPVLETTFLRKFNQEN